MVRRCVMYLLVLACILSTWIVLVALADSCISIIGFAGGCAGINCDSEVDSDIYAESHGY